MDKTKIKQPRNTMSKPMNPEDRPVMFINVGKYYDAEQVRETKKKRTF